MSDVKLNEYTQADRDTGVALLANINEPTPQLVQLHIATKLAAALRESAADKQRIANLESSVANLKDDIRRLDAVIDEEGVARSCISPIEDLRIAIRKLKGRAERAESELDAMRAKYNMLKHEE